MDRRALGFPSRREIAEAMLEELSTRGDLAPNDMFAILANRFKLSDEQLNVLVTDGSESVWANNVRWARNDLARQGLLDATVRGVWRLTDNSQPETLPAGEPRWWWVNQNKTYKQERQGEYIWAPQRTKNGGSAFHHANVAQVRQGDVIFHYSNQQICAVSVAESDAFVAAKPPELPSDTWETEGYMVRVKYHDLMNPINRDSIPLPLRIEASRQSRSAFTSGGTVNQGYLFALSPSFVSEITHLFPQLVPDGVELPAAVLPSSELRTVANELIEKIKALNVNKDYGVVKPYKPAVLLAAIDAIDHGELADNKIAFSSILPRFVESIKHRFPKAGAAQAQEAFFRLDRDGIWNFHPLNGQPISEQMEPAQLRRLTAYAFFPERYWDVLRDDSLRREVRSALIKTWFDELDTARTDDFESFDLPSATADVIEFIASKGFHFEPWQIAAYLTALRTKPFAILAGVSGSGKSQLPLLVATATGSTADLIPVRPDWTDSSDVLGFVQLQGRLSPGRLLHLAKDAGELPDQCFVAVIDEMNLARVEHYFAEVLSLIEANRGGSTSSGRLMPHDLKEEDDAVWLDVTLPPNLAIVGTVNMDESTHGFSKKVLDRAFTLEFSEVNLRQWKRASSVAQPKPRFWPARAWQPIANRLSDLENLDAESEAMIDSAVVMLVELNQMLAQAQLQLAYRSRDEIVLFMLHARELGQFFVDSTGEAISPLDLGIQMKVLPRIAGGSGPIRNLVLQLLGWSYSSTAGFDVESDADALLTEWRKSRRPTSVNSARFPRTCARLCLMWERLLHEGFTSYWL